jgi:N-acetylglucosaminyl-diphospho-decaprenol L-rhamnosyltransferase
MTPAWTIDWKISLAVTFTSYHASRRTNAQAARYPISLTPQSNAEQEKPAPRVTVAVVSHDRVLMLRQCLASLEKSEGREKLQIVVVENGSTDGSAQLDSEFPDLQWIRLPKNFGLTKAMNLGWRAADAEYVLFLHDDTELPPEAVMRLADALDANPDAAAVCPLLVDTEGRPAPQFGSLPPSGLWRPAQLNGDEPQVVEYPRAAALMARIFYIRATRHIDERFGQFGGDADLAAQFRRASKKILLIPTVRVVHRSEGLYTTLERADALLARAAFMGKYQGFAAGMAARLGSIVGPLFGFRFGELRHTLGGQKIDGSQ